MSLYLIKRRLIWNKEKCHSRQNNLLSVSLTTFIDKLHDSNHCYAHFQARILHERNGHGGGGHHGHGVHAGRSGLAPLDRLSSASDSHLDCTCCSCDWISKALLCRQLHIPYLDTVYQLCNRIQHTGRPVRKWRETKQQLI